MQPVKKEPKTERSDSAGPVEVERERIRQDDPPLDPGYLANQPRINRVRQQGLAVGRVLGSPPPDDALRQQEELPTNIRPAKKKKQCDGMFASVVDDVQYRNIIKSPNGDGDGLVELSCKFCGANCSIHTSVKLLFRGDNAWRGHIQNCHRRSLPAGTKITAKYMITNCLTMRALTPEEVKAVLNHKHEEFVVIMKAGPGAEPGGPNSKRKRKRSAATANVYEEGEAEREILEAIDDPGEHEFATVSAKDDVNLGADEEGDECGDTEYAPEDRLFGLPTRKGGRRTRYTPDFVAGNVE